MATLNQKREAEGKMRELLERNDLPPPDDVEYGDGCIRLLWHQQKAAVVVDIDNPDGAMTFEVDGPDPDPDDLDPDADLGPDELDPDADLPPLPLETPIQFPPEIKCPPPAA